MENPCKLLFFGDSITKGYTPIFEQKFRSKYPEINLTVVNAGVSGETSADGIIRLPSLLEERPDVVVIGFGMNDWRKGVSRSQYKKNLITMLDSFESVNTRVIISTVSPSYNFKTRSYNYEVDSYSDAVREIAIEKRIKIADINALWKKEIKKPQKGLRDELHPNSKGYNIICKSLLWVIPRRNTTILWQYNGPEAKCNYRCPYCYYIGLHSPVDRSFGLISEWHQSLKSSFGNQHLILYLGHGEPSLGELFPKIIEMCESEPNWELRIISNIDTNQIKLAAESNLAKMGRFHIVGSYHPCMISREEFLKRLKYFREKGIEIPIVYVAYPPYLKHFADDINFFRKEGFIVHVRRLQGKYRGKIYPYAYTEEERVLIARYMDYGMLKYMHSGVSSEGKLTFAGIHFFIMDNVGNVGYDSNIFPPYSKYSCIFGNIHKRTFKPLLLPGPYPGTMIGTDDGIANTIEYNYKELEGNHVISFSSQGGVYKDSDGNIIYENEFKDYNNPKIRAEFNFPPRGIRDLFALGLKKGCIIITTHLFHTYLPHLINTLRTKHWIAEK